MATTETLQMQLPYWPDQPFRPRSTKAPTSPSLEASLSATSVGDARNNVEVVDSEIRPTVGPNRRHHKRPSAGAKDVRWVDVVGFFLLIIFFSKTTSQVELMRDNNIRPFLSENALCGLEDHGNSTQPQWPDRAPRASVRETGFSIFEPARAYLDGRD